MPRMTRGKGFDASIIMWFLIFAVAGMYMFSSFTEPVACTPLETLEGDYGCSDTRTTHLGFAIPDDIDVVSMVVLKIVIVGLVTFAAYAMVKKLTGGAMSKRDALTLILLGIGLWFLWDQILTKLLGWASINDITFAVAKKTGLIP